MGQEDYPYRMILECSLQTDGIALSVFFQALRKAGVKEPETILVKFSEETRRYGYPTDNYFKYEGFCRLPDEDYYSYQVKMVIYEEDGVWARGTVTVERSGKIKGPGELEGEFKIEWKDDVPHVKLGKLKKVEKKFVYLS
jgi:hypothetical protein